MAHRKETAKGIFKKRKETVFHPPFAIYCPICFERKILFHSEKHGWDGQEEQGRSVIDIEEDLEWVSEVSGSVFCTHSYQGIENYEDLIEEGVLNPEDFFDTFTVYFGEAGSPLPECVASVECV